MHDNLAAFPVKVIQRQSANLSGTQSEPCQKQQDGIIAHTRWKTAIAAVEQALHILGWERFGQLRESPVGNARQTGSKISLDDPTLCQKAKERAQRCDYGLDAAATDTFGFSKDKTVQMMRA